ncbi:MAG: tetraprenyl-beta-curcumene synthase family protein [Limnochordia bacterium]
MPGPVAIGTTLLRYLGTVLPEVERQLGEWRIRADAIPDRQLRVQALASLSHKRFHCQGGSIFCAAPGEYRPQLLRFIVAYQTMCDYLDNLCDRAGVIDEYAFRLLHRSMQDAVSGVVLLEHPGYYALYPWRNDGAYLEGLVSMCQHALREFPYYRQVQPAVEHLVSLYTDLQVYKHLESSRRVDKLRDWFGRQWRGKSPLYWQEFAAACGSTLAVFALCHAAAGPSPPKTAALLDAYFPWVAGWHILLDYLIDLAEDRQGGDLNFVSFYENLDVAEARLNWLYQEAADRLSRYEAPAVHVLVLHGLPAMYLSDAKVAVQDQRALAERLLRSGGSLARTLHLLCRLARRFEGGRSRCPD